MSDHRSVAGPPDDSSALVEVYWFRLDPPPPVLSRFASLLDDDEQRRACRFRTETLRRRFIAGRGGLRTLLGRSLGCDPSAVSFVYGPHGKPALKDVHGPDGLEFNLAHSHDLAVCALTRGRAVGVDVEAIRTEHDSARILHRYFSPAERAAFLALPQTEQVAAFFRGWSRKEAFLKATGTGLATALDSFDVTLGPDEPAALLRVGTDPDEAGRWSLIDLDAGPGYAAALVVAGSIGPADVWWGNADPWPDRYS